ncbi:MAG TPA: hypothetical protein VFZ59_00775 [Verrucomicrobiae bacterium]|nr:hypothetical protein [Verrucomicrobiae bacterium]
MNLASIPSTAESVADEATRRNFPAPQNIPPPHVGGYARVGIFNVVLVSILVLVSFAAHAHLGSPNVYFEGPAGPYPIRVVIQPPGVVPGLAQIHVRARSTDVEKVTVLPVRWNAGTRGAPQPDVAKPVAGETNLFTAQLWLMDSGAYSVFVDVTGPRGRGTAIVPFNSLALERREMSRGVTLVFLGVGCALAALLVCVVGAAIREAVVPPGAEPTTSRRWFARLGMAISLLIAGGAVVFGKGWWDKVDQTFRRHRLYQTPAITPTLALNTNGETQLSLRIESGGRRHDSTPLIPDHGQLMHLFLIRQQGDAFAHLHPARDSKSGTFSTHLPALPAGEYQLYADITHESGFSQTLTNLLKLSAATGGSSEIFASPDDSLTLAAPQSLSKTNLPGGFVLTPTFSPPFSANKEITLAFNLVTDAGAPAPVEPYLGMYGHLVIQHADGTVFTHLHPLGSISMASQRRFAEREHAGYLANQSLDLLCSPASTALSFPYAFPKPGPYRLWLQTKLQGQIRTVAYQVEVE